MTQGANEVDFAVIGAGAYGLHAAFILGKKGYQVGVFDVADGPFRRASYINQTRVHQGYHYPRSIYTALASIRYFERFNKDFQAAINDKFTKIYAISARNSFTSHRQFVRFCKNCGIPIREVDPRTYFNSGIIEGSYETKEFSFDPDILCRMQLEANSRFPNISYRFNRKLVGAERLESGYRLDFEGGEPVIARGGVVSCVYASVNQILRIFSFPLLDIQYEICEVSLGQASSELENIGITVMDGQFFSVMPFGKKGLHSMTAVDFTPHLTSRDPLPSFRCQDDPRSQCTPEHLDNCNTCAARPRTAYRYMAQLARKYLKEDLTITYRNSLYAIKPILRVADIDDGRPTVVNKLSSEPLFVSVLSGKINTIYELEGALNDA